MRFAWIQSQKKAYPIGLMCKVLEVCRSGYYAWVKRPPGPRAKRREELTQAIRQAHDASRKIYGSPRVHRQLKDQGVSCCENTVAKVMRENDLFSKVKREFKVVTTDSDHDYTVADNVLDRGFEQAAPNRAWVADITYIPTAEGGLYLAAVLDLHSRKVVGWSMADHLRTELVSEALGRAVAERQPGAGLVHHSDRGVQYASDAYQALLAGHGMVASMSRKANCWDNAAMESFFGTLKTELVHHETYTTRDQARQSVFEYIEVFYNRQRRHSTLGCVSPAEFERAA